MKFNRRDNQTTIMEVALAAGVSLATVSRVTNHPEKVKPETREKIEKIIKDRGYKPNLNAKSLAISKSKTVAVVVPELTRSSIAGLVDGIADCAKKRGYMLRLFVNKQGTESYVNENEYWSEILSTVVDGILYINDELTKENINNIKKSFVPVVLTNTVCDDDEIPFVSIDYYKASYEITKNMIEQGNKKIWLITTITKYVVNDLKVAGYTKAMQEAGLEPLVKYVHGKIDANTAEYNELLDKDVPEVAIVVRDSMAVNFINCARLHHLSIPGQVQVIGFQNTKYAELSRPTLTCIETPIYDLGEQAMQLLSDMMNVEEDEEIEVETKNYVNYQIVKRQSTR